MYTLTCTSKLRCCPAWQMLPHISGVTCMCLLCFVQYSTFNIPYTSGCLCDEWQDRLGWDERRKGRMHGSRSASVLEDCSGALGMAVGVSHVEERQQPPGECRGLQPSCWVPRGLTLDKGKNTDLKGRVSAYGSGWNKTQRTLPRITGCLLAPPLSL